MRSALMFVFALLLVACGSTPQTDYYLLTADADRSSELRGPTLGIAELNLAEYLRRPELVTLQSSNRLHVDPYRRWAEPLDDGMRRTLALNLSALLGSDGVRNMPWPRDWVPQWLLRVSIARMDVGQESIELVAVWSLQDGRRAHAAVEHTSRLGRARSGDSADSIAADMSQSLLALSQEIVASIDAGAAADDSAAQTQ